MSQENVEIVKASFDAWNTGDLDAIRRVYVEDGMVETDFTMLSGTFEGDDPIGRWVAEQREAWAQLRWELDRIFEVGDAVVSFYRTIAVGRKSGIRVVRELAGVYRIRDGKIASERVYLDRSAALKAVGLEE
jgi:ketosteroid isomerase-like protein